MSPQVRQETSTRGGVRAQSMVGVSCRRRPNFVAPDVGRCGGWKSRPSCIPRAMQVEVEPGPTTASPKTSTTPFRQQDDGLVALKDMTLSQLEDWCASVGEPQRRAIHVWRWMYADGCWIHSFDDTQGLQDGFSRGFCDKVRGLATLHGGLHLQHVRQAADGTRKMVFQLTDGPASGHSVETVLIPVVRKQGQRRRLTICVSSQVGCAMNCQFCFTGRMGLQGNLTAAQIVEQVVTARRFLAEAGEQVPVTGVVFMGMGEPLDNLPAVLAAANIMCHPLGLHISHNRITISTVGLIPQMRLLHQRSTAQMALSLHATTDEVRDWIAPVNRRYPLQDLLGALREMFPRGKAAGGQHILIEYVMLKDINDTLADVWRLIEQFESIEAKFNLILFNMHEGTAFVPSELAQVTAFRALLIAQGRVCTIRDSRGSDEMAACGQLGSIHLAPRLAPRLSRYPGVSWSREKEAWLAHAAVDGARQLLGTFDSEREAAFACRQAAGADAGTVPLEFGEERCSAGAQLEGESLAAMPALEWDGLTGWRAEVCFGDDRVCVGYFQSAEEAVRMHQRAADELQKQTPLLPAR